MLVEYVEFLMFLILGLGIGYNLRNERALKLEKKTFEMVDENTRQRLEISENLNTSLKEDIKFLKAKIDRLNQEFFGKVSQS